VKPAVSAVSCLFLAASVLGCTDGRMTVGVGEQQNAIVGGTPSLPADDAVVALNSGSLSCSATLVAPDIAVTALHCVTAWDPKASFSCKSDGSLDPRSKGGTLGATVDPASVYVVTGVIPGATRTYGKAIYTTNSPEICRDDLAVVVLQGPVDIGGAPLPSLRFARTTKVGEPVRVVGYGGTLTSMDPGRHARDGLSVLGVGSPNAVIPGDPGVPPRTLMVGEGPCQGDSGGPLYSVETGAEIGVLSILAAASCQGSDVRNIYTQIAPYESMIRDAFTSVGEEPTVEVVPETGAGGEGGVTGQAGEPGNAGVPGEGAAPNETGGSGGQPAAGGRGGSDAVAGSTPTGTGGGTTNGDDTGDAGAESTGSGSRRDPSCSCRVTRLDAGTHWSAFGFALAFASLLRRRRSR
jgi:hypothetical protein